MEDVDGGLSIPERSISTVGRKSKQTNKYDKWGMGDPWQKGTGNNMTMHGGVGSF